MAERLSRVTRVLVLAAALASCKAQESRSQSLGNGASGAESAGRSLSEAVDELARDLETNLRRDGSTTLRVAVMDFATTRGQECALGAVVAERLTTRLFREPSFAIIERRLLENVMREQRVAAADMVDPSSAARIGRILGATAIVIGTITGTSTQYSVDARVIMVESGMVASVGDAAMARNDEVEQLGTCGDAPARYAAPIAIEGDWDTVYATNEGSVRTVIHFVQDGASVTGTYGESGRYSGTLVGRELRGNWWNGSDSGAITFVFSENARQFEARWGNGTGPLLGTQSGTRR